MSLNEALVTIGIVAAICLAIWVAGRILKRLLGGKLGEVVELISQLIPVLILGTVAIGILLIIDPDQGDLLLDSTVRSVPRVMLALIIVIIARGLGRIVGMLVETGLRRVSPVMASRTRMLLSGVIMGIGLVIALQQVGISTDIILILVAALAFGTALAVALAVGLGSVQFARQVAAGRHVQHRFAAGQVIKFEGVEGRVQSIGLSSTRIEAMDGGVLDVPNESFLSEAVLITNA